MASSLVYMRLLGYVTTIVVQVGNSLLLLDKDPGEDERVRRFVYLQYRYLTSWTFLLQILYALTGVVCEILNLKNSRKKNYLLPKYLRGFRDTLFSAIIVPSTCMVVTVFWPLFLYDRSLILPEFVDHVLPRVSNHIVHTLIVPMVLWEITFQPRTVPKSHFTNIFCLILYFTLFLCTLLYTYYELDHWLYPIFGLLYETDYFYVVVVILTSLAIMFYYSQWTLVQFVWGKRTNGKSKKIN